MVGDGLDGGTWSSSVKVGETQGEQCASFSNVFGRSNCAPIIFKKMLESFPLRSIIFTSVISFLSLMSLDVGDECFYLLF